MRISTTTLESFRLFCEADQEWMTEAMLIDGILGKFVPTHPVLLGQAFGKVLETPDAYAVAGGYRYGDFAFGADVMDPCLAVIDRRGVFEAKATKRYGLDDVVAMADHLYGAHLSEFKTTCSTFDFDKYAASCQWRFMVDLFEPLDVTYHVFCLAESPNGVVSLRSIESFTLYPYAALHRDCVVLLDAFTRYVKAKGLDGYLDQRQREAA